MTGERGFSLVELLIASMIFACAAGLLFGFITSAQRAGRAQPDAADVNQRLRVAAAAIERDLVAAGTSSAVGAVHLANYMPPIRPARTGANGADGEFQASHKYAEAAEVLATQPGSLQLRYLQTLVEIAAENNSTTVFPLPIELLEGLVGRRAASADGRRKDDARDGERTARA